MEFVRPVVLGTLLGTALLSCSCQNQFQDIAPASWSEEALPEDASAEPPSVKKLAQEIDCLEKHIEKYGSIVPKHADVWGQARLMMYTGRSSSA